MTTKAQERALLNSITNPRQRRDIERILNGQIVAQVRCMSESCNGRIIANIYKDGKVELTFSPGKNSPENVAWLRSHRNRLDGFLGFECWCGNDSRLSKQEVGHVSTGVTKEGLKAVAKNVDENPSRYEKIGDSLTIDGFVIQDVG